MTGAAAPPDKADDSLSLRIGTRMAEFEITGRVGEGGFSIVYLALDHSLERTVALKEYMPSSLAARVGDTRVQPRSNRYRDTFEAGLRSFVNEAKLLAQFDHPALVKVYRFWEANGTAYMVMPFYQGVTLKDAARALPTPPDEAWLMTLLAPMTEALMVVHAERCYHRDIAPDNVLLLAGSGKPLLLDFGAARRVIGDMTQALTVILKPGYAPIEQYAEVPGMKQGPWTDVYALAARGLLGHHRQDAARFRRPGDERFICTVGTVCCRPLQPAVSAGDRSCTGRVAGTADAVDRGVSIGSRAFSA